MLEGALSILMKCTALFLAAICSLGLLHAQEDTSGDAGRRFEGTIGENLKITLLLESTLDEDGETSYDGAYHYHKTGIPISLTQVPDAGELIRLRENEGSDAEGRETFTGQWAVKLDGTDITGTWSTPDGKKKLPISLRESYPAGSVRVVTTQLESVQTLRKNGGKRGFEIKVRYLQLASRTAAAAEINRVLRQDALNVPVNEDEDPTHIPENPTEKDILAAMVMKEEAGEDEDWEAAFVESVDDSQSVMMNESGFLTVEYVTWTYTGGAHGNYGSSYRSFDLESGQELLLEDLVKTGYEKRWATLGAAELLLQQGLKPDAPLTEVGLFEDTLELNETWFLTPGGIGFSYDPYEIGPYGRGMIQFVLPWKDILPDLKPGSRIYDMASRLGAKTK
ncbi:uncharacterized protein DUF4163 [Prosthecobacter fusiformis]|uniref:Uncharacterized protein DUF4163 n=2 Tax=Prosthecobacter fusiformis TaxID=48464 RepID=A0A4V3FFI8_9BACT|nr:uncharacterized protein DUF4163 [Prosthecobacter fusiformis]